MVRLIKTWKRFAMILILYILVQYMRLLNWPLQDIKNGLVTEESFRFMAKANPKTKVGTVTTSTSTTKRTKAKSMTTTPIINIVRISGIIHKYFKVGVFSSEKLSLNYLSPNYYSSQYQNLLKEKQIEFRYKDFRLVEPHFSTEEDRLLFLNNSIYVKDLEVIPAVRLRGIVAVQENAIAYDRLDCGWKNNLTDYEYTNNSGENNVNNYFNGTLCPLLIPDSFAFQHFIDGVLPKLMQVYDYVVNSNVYFLIYKPRDSLIYDFYDKLGISRDRLLFYDKKPMKVKRMINTCIAPPIHPTLWLSGREALGLSADRLVPMNQTLVVFIRRINTHNGGRKILNSDQVEKVLNHRYGNNGVRIFSGGVNFKETVSLFQRARIIIGVHGGALYNIIFAPQQTSVIEIMPTLDNGQIQPGRLAHEIIWFQAQFLGQSYWRLPIQPELNKVGYNVNVDIGRLEVLLNKVDTAYRA
ncbi:uncharacterized protein LOC126815686 [Patella vulgata]|uniref:uncharacterized protein LOC126815686 n=1 Tax=Patella vulgata TaxID=6465 RepID=UPI0024A82111|nr:uncharacterized protein LOC126815686 [Patella vulgata]XP_055955908.1 uncharacterized protein LOC126815686 [Patella vulgata]